MSHQSQETPRISLIIPAWNEAELLPRLLDSVEIARQRFAGGAGRIEVVVADNDSTDETAEIATQRGYRVVTVQKRCIAAARNGGAAAASGELLAFCDADFRIHPETFNFISEVMGMTGVVGGGTGITMERWSWGIRATLLLILPPLLLFGVDGGIWFCRRSDFEEIGGYDESIRAGEDVMFLLNLKRLGRSRKPRQKLVNRISARKLNKTPPFVVNSARKFDKHGEWHMIRDVLRNLPRLFFHRQKVDEFIDRYWYRDRVQDVEPNDQRDSSDHSMPSVTPAD